MLTNLIKPYGLLCIDEGSVNIILLIFPIANGAFRVLWGYFCDKIGFKKTYLILLTIGVQDFNYLYMFYLILIKF